MERTLVGTHGGGLIVKGSMEDLNRRWEEADGHLELELLDGSPIYLRREAIVLMMGVAPTATATDFRLDLAQLAPVRYAVPSGDPLGDPEPDL